MTEDDITHAHGMRVRGYNETKEALGKPVAGAHGGWTQKEDAETSGNSRYDRFLLSTVVRIAACIAHIDPGVFGESSEEPGASVVPSGTIRERAAGRPLMRMTRHAVVPADEGAGGDSGADAPAALMTPTPGVAQRELPPGWTRERRAAPSGRVYNVYHGPNGERARSLPAAWRVATDEAHGTDSDSAASGPDDRHDLVVDESTDAAPVVSVDEATVAAPVVSVVGEQPESPQVAPIVAGDVAEPVADEPVADADVVEASQWVWQQTDPQGQFAADDVVDDGADEVQAVVEESADVPVDEQHEVFVLGVRRCGTLGCTYEDFHLGPHSFQLVDGRTRRTGLLGGPPLTAVATASPPRV